MFPAIAQTFCDDGTLDPVALYLILDWKAPRARTPHRSWLARIAGSFSRAVNEVAIDLRAATAPEERLGVLLTKWGFRLPTASAILTVLYPDTFTIYDVRVCNALHAFHQLGGMKWSPQTWREHQRFIGAVRDAAPQGLSLRDCDRWLWGRDKQKGLLSELAEPS